MRFSLWSCQPFSARTKSGWTGLPKLWRYVGSIIMLVLFRAFGPTGRAIIAQDEVLGTRPIPGWKPQRGALPALARPVGPSGWVSCGSPRAAPRAMIARPLGPKPREPTEQNQDRFSRKVKCTTSTFLGAHPHPTFSPLGRGDIGQLFLARSLVLVIIV